MQIISTVIAVYLFTIQARCNIISVRHGELVVYQTLGFTLNNRNGSNCKYIRQNLENLDYLRSAEMARQKSLRQMAKELQISPSYLSMILSGERKCPQELFERIQPITTVHKVVNSEQNQIQPLPSKQRVGRSNRPWDTMKLKTPLFAKIEDARHAALFPKSRLQEYSRPAADKFPTRCFRRSLHGSGGTNKQNPGNFQDLQPGIPEFSTI